MFKSMLSSYNSGSYGFLKYWDDEDAKEIKKIRESGGTYASLSSNDLNLLEQCSGGYEILGTSRAGGGLAVLFLRPQNRKSVSAFFLKESGGQYKFARTGILGNLGAYATSFFGSEEVRNIVSDPAKSLAETRALAEKLLQD